MDKKEVKNNKTFTGVVTSDSMDKTVVVSVQSFQKHSLYGKFMKSHKKYHAHDEGNEYKTGDNVVMEEVRPISKKKTFKVLRKLDSRNLDVH